MLVLEFHDFGKVQSILASEQEVFNQTDLPALNRRDFTACSLFLALQRARYPFNMKWNNQCYYRPCCILPAFN